MNLLPSELEPYPSLFSIVATLCAMFGVVFPQ